MTRRGEEVLNDSNRYDINDLLWLWLLLKLIIASFLFITNFFFKTSPPLIYPFVWLIIVC